MIAKYCMLLYTWYIELSLYSYFVSGICCIDFVVFWWRLFSVRPFFYTIHPMLKAMLKYGDQFCCYIFIFIIMIIRLFCMQEIRKISLQYDNTHTSLKLSTLFLTYPPNNNTRLCMMISWEDRSLCSKPNRRSKVTGHIYIYLWQVKHDVLI